MNRWAAAALLALLPARARAQETPTPTPAPSETPAVAHVDSREARDLTATRSTSLADIVRRAQEQREREGRTPRKSLGVITNENLKGVEAQPGGTKGSRTPTPTPRFAARAESPGGMPELRDLKGRNEADWKGMLNESQTRVARANTRVQKLENETKKLENDFYAWSDGSYRERVIKPAWDKALEDLKRARLEADAARQALSDLEEEARKSGAPPGWLR